MEPVDPYGGDPVLRATVERALAPYRRLPPELLAALRDLLIVHATTHPALAPLHENLRRRDEVDRSGTAPIDERAPSTKPRAAGDR